MEWIKMRVNLRDDPAVILISQRLKLSRDEVVGKLHRFWSWADQQTETGDAPVTLVYADECADCSGFSAALVEVGWLSEDKSGHLHIPNFDRHNGQTAKRRALTAKRNRKYRDAKRDAPVTQTMSPEKRREDIYERGAAEIDDGDDLDHEVRAYFAEPDAPTFDMKAASNMRKLVELAGWESAREYVKRGIAGGNAFPVSWALRVFQSDKAKADVRAQSETVGKRTRPTGVVIHGEV